MEGDMGMQSIKAWAMKRGRREGREEKGSRRESGMGEREKREGNREIDR